MIPASITCFAALLSFRKAIFSQESKDGLESTVSDCDESRTVKWAKIQNLVDRIEAHENDKVLEDQDLSHIFTPALMALLGDLKERMAKCKADVLDFKKCLKSDLDAAYVMLEGNLNDLLATKIEAQKLAHLESERAAERARLDAERAAERARLDAKDAAEREYQERKDAADRAHQLELAAIEHRGCCVIS